MTTPRPESPLDALAGAGQHEPTLAPPVAPSRRAGLVAAVRRGLRAGEATVLAIPVGGPLSMGVLLLVALAFVEGRPVAAGPVANSAAGDASKASAPAIPSLMEVRVEGLDCLRLRASRQETIFSMRLKGYTCFDEAATSTIVPCTLVDPRLPQAQVVLTFAGDRLDKVRTPLALTTGDPRDDFDRRYRSAKLNYTNAWVERSDEVWIARFLPGDGSMLEMRLFISPVLLEILHLAPIANEGVRDSGKVNGR